MLRFFRSNFGLHAADLLVSFQGELLRSQAGVAADADLRAGRAADFQSLVPHQVEPAAGQRAGDNFKDDAHVLGEFVSRAG